MIVRTPATAIDESVSARSILNSARPTRPNAAVSEIPFSGAPPCAGLRGSCGFSAPRLPSSLQTRKNRCQSDLGKTVRKVTLQSNWNPMRLTIKRLVGPLAQPVIERLDAGLIALASDIRSHVRFAPLPLIQPRPDGKSRHVLPGGDFHDFGEKLSRASGVSKFPSGPPDPLFQAHQGYEGISL